MFVTPNPTLKSHSEEDMSLKGLSVLYKSCFFTYIFPRIEVLLNQLTLLWKLSIDSNPLKCWWIRYFQTARMITITAATGQDKAFAPVSIKFTWGKTARRVARYAEAEVVVEEEVIRVRTAVTGPDMATVNRIHLTWTRIVARLAGNAELRYSQTKDIPYLV